MVEQTLEIMDRMGFDDESCKMLEYGTQVALHFKSVYDRYTKYRRDHVIVGECLTYSQFMRQLRKSDLYIETKVIRFGSETRKAVVLNYEVLSQRCEVSGFDTSGAMPLSGTD